MKLIDRHEFNAPRISDALIFKCQCRCVCDNERLRNQSICNYCFIADHEEGSLIGPPKPSRFAEQCVYVLDDGGYEIR